MRMINLAAAAFVAFAALGAGAGTGGATPKIGTSISLIDDHSSYRSNAFFQTRPIAKELKKAGLELCLYNGPGKNGLDSSLRQFNAVWLLLEHEGMNRLDPDTVGRALRSYVEAGGGLVINHSPGRYPEAAVDSYWDRVFTHLDMKRLHEEIVDRPSLRKVNGRREMFHVVPGQTHPVTAGVAGLWIPCRGISGAWGSHAIVYSPAWKTVVAAPESAQSYCKNKDTNNIDYNRPGFYRHGGPLVAVRELGKGRIVSIAVHKDNSGWAYGIDRWPDLTERGVFEGKPSDQVKLLENALRWVSAPSLARPEFTRNYRPVEPVIPPHVADSEFGGNRAPEALFVRRNLRNSGATGVIGLHSTHSDGKSTVAEYAAEAKKLGLNFIVFTDPLDKITVDGLQKLRAECKAVSGPDFYACPGLEYTDLSGLEWVVFHDRVAYPSNVPVHGKYPMFNGKTVLQRNAFGGHQNLFRGAVVNLNKLKEIGAEPVNLVYFSGVIPRAYDKDKLIADNEAVMRQTAANLHRYAPFSFTRIRTAADLGAAVRTSVTKAATLADVRKTFNASGWGANDAAVRGRMWVQCGPALEINQFDLREWPGTRLASIAFSVSSPAGIESVSVVDADRRELRRFAGNGEKSLFREFVMPFDAQCYPQLIVRDRAGNRAYSTNYWLYRYHAGLFRCGDNSNLLSQRPNMVWSPNWDCAFAPVWKMLYEPEKRHYHISEAHLWDIPVSSRLPSYRVWNEWCPVRFAGVDFPGKFRAPSMRTVFTLNQPGVVSIVDQFVGERIKAASGSDVRASYANCSIQPAVAENPYFRRHQRVYQFVDRIDTWWRAVWKQVIPAYRGGYSVIEGEVRFLQPVKLAAPILLTRLSAANPEAPVEVLRSGEGSLGSGGYVALVSDPTAWHAAFGLTGSEPIRLKWQGDAHRRECELLLGETNREYPAGTVLRYRFAIGSFIEPPRGGEYLKWFATMLDGSGLKLTALRGKITGISGFVNMTAERCAAELGITATSFVQDYPIAVGGLADNGAACWFDGKTYQPLAFENGVAWCSYPLENSVKLWIGNLFVAADPAIRFAVIPKMKNYPQSELEIHNPTDRTVETVVRSPRFGGEFKVRVAPGSTVTKTISMPGFESAAIPAPAASPASGLRTLIATFHRNAQADRPAALRALEAAEKLEGLTPAQRCEVLTHKIGLLYHMPDSAKACTEAADALLAIPEATPVQRFSAYFLGGIRYGKHGLNNIPKYLEYMEKTADCAVNDDLKFSSYTYRIQARQENGNRDGALALIPEALEFARSRKNRNQELRIYYVAWRVQPADAQTAYQEAAIAAPDALRHAYGQHIALSLVNGAYRNDPAKRRALCERVIREAPRLYHPEFRKILEAK